MTVSYSFDVESTHGLARVTLAGFFTVDDVANFVADRNKAFRRLKCRPNQHVTLVDVRGMNIQTQDSVEEFQKMLSDPRTAGRRIAFVVAQSLARMQAQRAAQGREAGYFTTPQEAEEWLLSDEAAAA